MECVEKIVKKDMIDPTNGKKMTEKDIIVLQRVRFLLNNEVNFSLYYSCDGSNIVLVNRHLYRSSSYIVDATDLLLTARLCVLLPALFRTLTHVGLYSEELKQSCL
jgi:hypothetical protein